LAHCRILPSRTPNVRSSAACFIDAWPVPGEARSRRSGCRSHIGCSPWCGSHLACAVPDVDPRAGRGSRGVCPAQSSVALPARQPETFEHRRAS
jgi:hypothetical protein